MTNIICGDLQLNGKNYKFDFRDNILVVLPNKLENFLKWRFDYLDKKSNHNSINLEGITNEGKYIIFVNVKFVETGRGSLQAFVPAYAICNSNAVDPLPKFERIEKLKFFGECLDKFYYPKQIIDYPEPFDSEYSFTINNQKSKKTQDYKVGKDTFSFGVRWNVPLSSDNNNVLNVGSFLEIKFDTPKAIDEVINYYLKVNKFFSFINYRKYVKFDNIIAYKSGMVQTGLPEQRKIEKTQYLFEMYFVDSEEKYDLPKSLDSIRLKDIVDGFSKLYKKITNKKFLINHNPLNQTDSNYIDNDKYINLSSSFESEFKEMYPDFKSSTSDEFNDVKKSMLKTLSNKKYYFSKKYSNTKIKKYKKIIEKCDYFSKIIKKIDGNLEEKIVFVYKKYNILIADVKQKLLKDYSINNDKASYGIIASKFAKRRNDISHGNGTSSFEPLEIIGYQLLQICIYCIIYELCGFNEEQIKEIINKMYKL